MDLSKKSWYFFVHCLSQILYVYIQGLEDNPPVFNLNDKLEDWTISQWKEYISYALQNKNKLAEICSQRGIPVKFLAQTIFEQLEFCKNNKIHLIFYGSTDYPSFLAYIPDPPLCLFATGDLHLLKRPCVSVIGSRKANPKAVKEAYLMGNKLSKAGFTIVSGGAFGCDIAAHEGSLSSHESSCPTVVVFPSGLMRPTPHHNRAIFSDISRSHGVFLSERFFNQFPSPRDYPVRNRIISGLSLWTVVAQASLKSGAMITARFALDHGRDVFVLEHDDHDISADGSKQLLEEGAIKVFDSDELLRFLIDERSRHHDRTLDFFSA